jgi:hypothetical protein
MFSAWNPKINGCQQRRHADGRKARQEHVLEPRAALRPHEPLPEQHADGQRNDDEDQHRIEQHLERDMERGGSAHQEGDDRREQHQH